MASDGSDVGPMPTRHPRDPPEPRRTGTPERRSAAGALSWKVRSLGLRSQSPRRAEPGTQIYSQAIGHLISACEIAWARAIAARRYAGPTRLRHGLQTETPPNTAALLKWCSEGSTCLADAHDVSAGPIPFPWRAWTALRHSWEQPSDIQAEGPTSRDTGRAKYYTASANAASMI